MPDLVPKIIHSLWMQGVEQAPEIVRVCLARWSELNPDYTLHVLNRDDVAKRLAGLRVSTDLLTPQTLSDLARARVLLTEGGVWVDAAVFAVRPLACWLPKFLRKSAFFAFAQPAPDRPLSSWFLAASPGHVLVEKWWREMDRFWSKPRTQAKYVGEPFPDGMQIPRDPVWEVAPEGGAKADVYPYFWFHYLFSYLLERDKEFAAQWQLCTKRSAIPSHRLLELCAKAHQPDQAEVLNALRCAPIHKLDWRQPYPLETLEELCRKVHPSDAPYVTAERRTKALLEQSGGFRGVGA